VFREIINTMETRPISPKGVFCSGVYYTRDDTYKDCYIQQGCSQQGAFRTSTFYRICMRTYSTDGIETVHIYHVTLFLTLFLIIFLLLFLTLFQILLLILFLT
jgi:hypothetical protein